MAKMLWPVVVFSLSLIACSVKQDVSLTKSALDATDRFHRDLESKEDKHILAEAAPELQASMNGDAITRLFSKVRKNLGKMISTQPTNIQVKHMPAGTLVVIQLQTRFENGSAQEILTWLAVEGRLRLRGYAINSPLLAENR